MAAQNNIVSISPEQLDKLVDAISRACGSSGNKIERSIYRPRNTTITTALNQEQKAIQRAAQNIDSVANRLLGLSKDLDQLKDLGPILENKKFSTAINLNEHSRFIAGILDEFENSVTDIYNVSVKLPEAIQKTAQEALSGNKLFLEIIQDKLPKTANDFLYVFEELQNKSQNASLKLSEIFSSFNQIETNIAIAESENRRKDIEKHTEQYKQNLIQLQQALKNIGITTEFSSEQIKKMSLSELRANVNRLKQQNNLSKVTDVLNEQLYNFANKLGTTVVELNRLDKKASTLFKKQQFEQLFTKMGASHQEIEFLKSKGFSNLEIFLRTLPFAFMTGVIKGLKLLIPQVVEITKTAFERGTAPQTKAAMDLKIGAADFQTVLADYKQTVLSGKGLSETLRILGDEKTREQFLKIAGYDSKQAALLSLRTQQFIKMYTQGTGDLQKGSQQWARHLRDMSVLTGKTADELLGLFEAQMETTEMQNVLLRLSGKEQQIMLNNIQLRQKEFTSLGLSIEKATNLAFALEKVRQEAVPDRLKQAGRLAQLAMRMGLGQEEALRLRQLYVTGKAGTEEFKRIAMRLGTLIQQRREQAQQFAARGIFAPEHEINRLLENIPGVAREIVTGFAELKEREGMRVSVKEFKTEAEAFDNSVLTFGKAVKSFQDTTNSLLNNLPGILENPVNALKQFSTSTGQLGKSVFDVAAENPIHTLILAIGGLTAAFLSYKTMTGAIGLGKNIFSKIGGFKEKTGEKITNLFKKSPSVLGEEPNLKKPKTISKPKQIPDLEKIKAVSSFAGKKLPFFVGTAFGIGATYSALKAGDITGAMLEASSALASAIPGIGTGLSVALDLMNQTRKEKQALAKESSGIVSPTLPRHEIAVMTMDKILTTQNEQLKQMVLLNKNTETLINLLTVGNKHAELTSTSIKDLTNAYYSVEKQKLSKEALLRAQTMRQYMAVPSVNPYFKSQ